MRSRISIEPRVSEELNSVETIDICGKVGEGSGVSEELNSVETTIYWHTKHSKLICFRRT